eukprot:scaffold336210_cov20-Prasinocladus_malaysianus.AAC.1
MSANILDPQQRLVNKPVSFASILEILFTWLYFRHSLESHLLLSIKNTTVYVSQAKKCEIKCKQRLQVERFILVLAKLIGNTRGQRTTVASNRTI